jgi:hypothetical protein
MILVVKGKDKKSRKQLKQGFKKTKYFFMCFYQSSGEYERNSYTLFKRGIHRPQPWGPKLSNNNDDHQKLVLKN